MSRLLPELLKKRTIHEQLVEDAKRDIEHLRLEVKMHEASMADEMAMIIEINRAIAALTPTPDFEAEKETAREQLEREPQIPEGLVEWVDGGHIDLTDDVHVEIVRRDGQRDVGKVQDFFWGKHFEFERNLDIIAYRIIEASPAPEPDEQDDASEFISILTGAPAIEPEAGLHGEPVELVYDVSQLLTGPERMVQAAPEEAPALNADMQDEREQPVTDVAALIASGEHSYDEVAAIAYPEPDGYAPVTNPDADALAKAHDWYDPKAVADRERNAGMARLFSYNPFYKPKVDA